MEEKEHIPQETDASSDDTLKALEECGKQRDEYLDGWKRAKADLINYKKDEMSRMEHAVKFGNEAILYDMLAVLDSFDIGIATLEKNSDAHKGMTLIRMQCEDIMRRYGLMPIDAPPGTVFDPRRHEAIEEVSSDLPPGAITEEVKRGYELHGKVLRPSKVKIAKQS